MLSEADSSKRTCGAHSWNKTEIGRCARYGRFVFIFSGLRTACQIWKSQSIISQLARLEEAYAQDDPCNSLPSSESSAH